MPLFPVLEIEALVQEKDKTRLDGSKSYAGGVNAITLTEIKPGEGGAFLDVTDDTFLDWQFDADLFDISAGLNDKVNFSEGGNELTATLAADEYTLAELATELQTKLNAAPGSARTYAVSLSGDKLTIAADGAFELLGVSGTNSANVLTALGFDEDVEDAATYTGDSIEQLPRTIYLRVTNDAVSPDSVTIMRQILTITEVNDHLFSTDDLLRKKETDILKYIPEGRATWKDVHRAAQNQMLTYLDTEGYIDDFGVKLTKVRIKDMTEVQEWATQVALRLIFDSVSNSPDDVFYKKARQYEKGEGFFRNRAVLRVDLNQDGRVDLGESLTVNTCLVVRR